MSPPEPDAGVPGGPDAGEPGPDASPAAGLSKIEVRSSAGWLKLIPESRSWGLGRKSRLALPYLTWIEIGPVPDARHK